MIAHSPAIAQPSTWKIFLVWGINIVDTKARSIAPRSVGRLITASSLNQSRASHLLCGSCATRPQRLVINPQHRRGDEADGCHAPPNPRRLVRDLSEVVD